MHSGLAISTANVPTKHEEQLGDLEFEYRPVAHAEQMELESVAYHPAKQTDGCERPEVEQKWPLGHALHELAPEDA